MCLFLSVEFGSKGWSITEEEEEEEEEREREGEKKKREGEKEEGERKKIMERGYMLVEVYTVSHTL